MAEIKIYKVVLDIVLFLIVFIPILLVEHFVAPFHRGFYCNDDTIKYPYKKDTISTLLLIVLGIAIPCIAIIFVEIGLFLDAKKRTEIRSSYFRPRHLNTVSVHPLVYHLYFIIGVFGFGMATTNLLTETIKLMMGRLRPHFIDVCKPNYNLFNCSDGYIEADVCTGDAGQIDEARLSFVSGHSSVAWYCALYLVLYLEVRFTWKISRLVKPVLQIAVLMLALMCSLSRISDYKHHWSDVLGGGLLGVIVAILTYYYVSGLPTMQLPLTTDGESTRNRDRKSGESYDVAPTDQDIENGV
ncbi:phospholipid phosphatase 1-like [Ptychodera flava]|uniref:phospholipid phosphatase 1-like n=1 Tax=Ptychodera flava TaxID=63121 RepID=UPI00396A777D